MAENAVDSRVNRTIQMSSASKTAVKRVVEANFDPRFPKNILVTATMSDTKSTRTAEILTAEPPAAASSRSGARKLITFDLDTNDGPDIKKSRAEPKVAPKPQTKHPRPEGESKTRPKTASFAPLDQHDLRNSLRIPEPIRHPGSGGGEVRARPKTAITAPVLDQNDLRNSLRVVEPARLPVSDNADAKTRRKTIIMAPELGQNDLRNSLRHPERRPGKPESRVPDPPEIRPFKFTVDAELEQAERITDFEDQLDGIINQLKTVLGDVQRMKLSGPADVSSEEARDTAVQTWKEEKTCALLTHMVSLRTMNRYQKLLLKKRREETEAARAVSDGLKNELDVYVAEAEYIRERVGALDGFRSRDENIPLVSVEEFSASAPAELKPPGLEENPHELRVARLKFELETRQELERKCEAARATRASLLEDVGKLRKELNLNGCGAAVENILESCEAAAEVSPDCREALDSSRLDQRAAFLPKPLSVILQNLVAFQEIYKEKITISIEGDANKARELRTSNPWEFLAVLPPKPDTSIADRIKVEVVEGAEAVDVKPALRMKKLAMRAWKKQNSELIREKRHQSAVPHPMSVLLTTVVAAGEGFIKVEFLYFPYFHFVTVRGRCAFQDWDSTPRRRSQIARIIRTNELLTEVTEILGLPNQAGQGDAYPSPNPSTKRRAERLNWSPARFRAKFSEKNFGVPFLWAQKLADMPFVRVGKTKDEECYRTFRRFIFGIQAKVLERYPLALQLAILEKIAEKNTEGGHVLDIPVDPSVQHLYPAQGSGPRTFLSTMKSATQEDLENYFVLGEMCADKEQISGIAEVGGNPVHLRYFAAFTREPAKSLVAILLTKEFPVSPPKLFVVVDFKTKRNAVNDEKVREIENELNEGWAEIAAPKKMFLLQTMHKVAFLLDCYLEARHPDVFPCGGYSFDVFKRRNRSSV